MCCDERSYCFLKSYWKCNQRWVFWGFVALFHSLFFFVFFTDLDTAVDNLSFKIVSFAMQPSGEKRQEKTRAVQQQRHLR